MIALYRSDRQAGAFETFRAGCALPREQLGVDPGPALRSAHQAVLTADFEQVLLWREGLVAGRAG
jgi:DNA-binding SARP family transcriptional activator